MIKVYYLRQLKDETTNTEYTEGSDYISQAINETTEKPDNRRVIIEESPDLQSLALKVEEPTERDLANYKSLPEQVPFRDLKTEIDALKVEINKLKTGKVDK